MIDLRCNETSFVMDRLARVGFNVSDDGSEKEIPTTSLSPDYRFLGRDVRHGSNNPVFPKWFQFLSRISDIPSFHGKGFGDTFAISDRGNITAVVAIGDVAAVQRNPFCKGTRLRFAVMLDDEPVFLSWSLPFA
jgi:hypothetical protein